MSSAESRVHVPWLSVGRAVVARPWLWLTALRQLRRLAPRGWWRRRPFLPVPDHEYLRFRMQTMYGMEQTELRTDDFVTYLSWCRRFPGR
jgi:hypothetical protein